MELVQYAHAVKQSCPYYCIAHTWWRVYMYVKWKGRDIHVSIMRRYKVCSEKYVSYRT